MIDEWGIDAFRFYVIRELDIGPDGNWTDAGFEARYSAELANGLDSLDDSDAGLDQDGDSYSNLEEYEAGSDPTVIGDVPTLRIKSFTTSSSTINDASQGVTLSWTSWAAESVSLSDDSTSPATVIA